VHGYGVLFCGDVCAHLAKVVDDGAVALGIVRVESAAYDCVVAECACGEEEGGRREVAGDAAVDGIELLSAGDFEDVVGVVLDGDASRVMVTYGFSFRTGTRIRESLSARGVAMRRLLRYWLVTASMDVSPPRRRPDIS